MLKITNLHKQFTGVYKPVINHLNLTLQPGDFCVLLGANGSGKSTLLKLISGEYTPNKGSITLNERPITNYRKRISMVIQDVTQGTLPDMTLLENLTLSYLRTRPIRLSPYRRYEKILTQCIVDLNLELEQYMHQPLAGLSGGQRQIIATVMALMVKPDLLLLDEHTSALDPKRQKQLMTYTAKTIKQTALTTIMITHKLEDAVCYGNRLILLHQGKIAIDFRDKQKSKLTTEQLLSYFHSFEDQALLSEV